MDEEPWFLFALALWVWLLFTSLISDWPMDSLTHSAPWIRFPVFAAAFAYFVTYNSETRERTLWGFAAGLVIMMGVLAVERYNNPDAIRLYGTWNQHIKAGWFMLGYGLLVSVWVLDRAKRTSEIWAIPIIAPIIAITVTTGEIYVTISLLFGICLVFLFNHLGSWRKMLLMGVIVATPVTLVLALSDSMRERFVFGMQQRLPWLPSSDYYPAWMGGLRVGDMNPVVGVGADNFDRVCILPGMIEKLDITICHSHPHQIYIQAYTEAGLIGLALFVLMVASILLKILPFSKDNLLGRFHTWMRKDIKTFSAQATTLVIVVLWPISTYSEAFGQHKNFFTWLAIGWAFALTQRFRNEKEAPLQKSNASAEDK